MRTRLVHSVCLFVAGIATLYATASFFAGFDGDFTIAAITAVLALGCVFICDHLAHERERLTHGREAVWGRRIEEDR